MGPPTSQESRGLPVAFAPWSWQASDRRLFPSSAISLGLLPVTRLIEFGNSKNWILLVYYCFWRETFLQILRRGVGKATVVFFCLQCELRYCTDLRTSCCSVTQSCLTPCDPIAARQASLSFSSPRVCANSVGNAIQPEEGHFGWRSVSEANWGHWCTVRFTPVLQFSKPCCILGIYICELHSEMALW